MKKSAFLYIILAGVFWGTSGIFVHFLAPYGFSSFQLASVRGTISFAVMAFYTLITNRGLFKTNIRELILFLVAGVAIYCTGGFYYAAMQETSVSTAVMLMYIAPVIVMFYSVAMLGEKLTPLKVISVAFMIVGCGFVSGMIGGLKFNMVGIVLGILSGIAYSTYNIVTKIEMKKKYNPLKASMYGFLFMMLISFIISRPSDTIGIAIANPKSIFLLLACGICTSVIPYFLYTSALKHLPAGTASALAIVEPMAATIFSIVFLNEILDIYSLIGIILILCAVFMLGKTTD